MNKDSIVACRRCVGQAEALNVAVEALLSISENIYHEDNMVCAGYSQLKETAEIAVQQIEQLVGDSNEPT